LPLNIFYSQNVEEALDFIKQHEPPEGYFVGFSGGKDSIVTLDLVRRAGVKHEAFYSMTLIDPPEVVDFIKKHYPEVTRLRAKMTFWQGILKNGLPYAGRRWCCRILKKDPAKKIPLKHRIMGQRMEESWQRAAQPRVGYIKTYKTYLYKPIFEWSSSDIWDYIQAENLPYPALYDEGFARLGCIVCPYIAGKALARNKAKWPGHYRILDKYMREYWELNKDKLEGKMEFEHYMKWPEWRTAVGCSPAEI
jgi:phosphoadenosine phosphosulfate reductase